MPSAGKVRAGYQRKVAEARRSRGFESQGETPPKANISNLLSPICARTIPLPAYRIPCREHSPHPISASAVRQLPSSPCRYGGSAFQRYYPFSFFARLRMIIFYHFPYVPAANAGRLPDAAALEQRRHFLRVIVRHADDMVRDGVQPPHDVAPAVFDGFFRIFAPPCQFGEFGVAAA